ncbi:DUF4167 domain-containing protein [Bartonella sp. CB189]|uniref:DUF4167 domain-containing protein n=1 Tax=Bartonella sp. CB189 TaxID=3112254 RepID=UPI002F96D9BB
MRPQQNRRVRGRNNNNNGNNNNRRGPNPLSRNYESSGPDVKIRGNAQQIADKYISLARDAQGSGDRIMSENYLQHAEHYLRIILAAAAQMSHSNRRDENSERECEEVNAEAEKRDDVSYEKSAQQKKNSSSNDNGQKIKVKNGHDGDALDPGALTGEENLEEKCDQQENAEIVKKTRRTSRRRVARSREEQAMGLEQKTQEIAENGDNQAEKIASIPLVSEEVQRKPRRRRVATSSAEGNI